MDPRYEMVGFAEVARRLGEAPTAEPYQPTAADLHAAASAMREHGARTQRDVEDQLTLHAAGVAEGSWEATRFCGWLGQLLTCGNDRDAARAQRWMNRLYHEVLASR
jgi:hypothetical protein